MKTSVVWFKTDLRLEDNETLVHAIEQSDEIVPVYCFDSSHYTTTEFGFQKTGSYRAKFILESVIDLKNQLKAKGSNLIIAFGKPEIEIPKIAKQYFAQKVFSKKEVAYEEKITEFHVENELWKFKCSLETFSTSTLYHAEDLPFSIKDIPNVFTTFRKKIEKESKIRKVFAKPAIISSPVIHETEVLTLTQLGIKELIVDSRAAINFKGGETEALNRLDYYFFKSKLLSQYKETRNQLIGPDYSSKFSAWLALGCISARYIFEQIKKYEIQYEANESTYWLEFELLWRDYFRFMFKKYKEKFFLQNGINNNPLMLKKHDIETFNKWKDGKTQIDFIDANMLELKLTGYMSNRGRQNVASYLCNDLKLNWQYGAAYFEEKLIDYDVCSNWGNWAYIAGVGNDPRPDRYFNIEKQALQYDQKKEYRNLWLTKTKTL